MGKFVGTLSLIPLDTGNGRNWQVEDPSKFISNNGDEIELVEGDISDLASTPRWLWIVYPPEGLYTVPSVFHDKGYKTQKYSRLRYDQMLEEMMADYKCWRFTQIVFYDAVRMGGESRWNQYKTR